MIAVYCSDCGRTMNTTSATEVRCQACKNAADLTPPVADAGEVRERVAREARVAMQRLANTKMELSLSDWGDISSPLFAAIDALLSPADITQVAPGFREGVEASAKVAKDVGEHRAYVEMVGGEWRPGSPYDRGWQAASIAIASAIEDIAK